MDQVKICDLQNSSINCKVLEKYKKFKDYSKLFFFPEISISYNLPAMVGLFICKDTFKK